MPSTSMATSSVSSRKWVSASPAEPTGWPASGPPLATWAVSRLARSSVCMWIHALVHVIAPKWIDAIRTVSATATASAQRYTADGVAVGQGARSRGEQVAGDRRHA